MSQPSSITRSEIVPRSVERVPEARALECLVEARRNPRPLLFEGIGSRWPALRRWTIAYLKTTVGEMRVPIKSFSGAAPSTLMTSFADYADGLVDSNPGGPREPYLHDFPLFLRAPALCADVEPFPSYLLPAFYRDEWWRFAQFFLGPTGMVTPLHFDCLETHNLFFQVIGRKQFTLVDRDDLQYCYRSGWRWFDVDPEAPDLDAHPDFRRVSPWQTIVGPGDALFIPSRVGHHVRSLDVSVSFNVDWHTSRTALLAAFGPLRGMPVRNAYYSAVCAVGLVLRLPSRWLFPLYRSYLTYVS